MVLRDYAETRMQAKHSAIKYIAGDFKTRFLIKFQKKERMNQFEHPKTTEWNSKLVRRMCTDQNVILLLSPLSGSVSGVLNGHGKQ